VARHDGSLPARGGGPVGAGKAAAMTRTFAIIHHQPRPEPLAYAPSRHRLRHGYPDAVERSASAPGAALPAMRQEQPLGTLPGRDGVGRGVPKSGRAGAQPALAATRETFVFV
jgi:hypothetical protein